MSAADQMARVEARKQANKLLGWTLFGWMIGVGMWSQSIPIAIFCLLVWGGTCIRWWQLVRISWGSSSS